MLTALALAAVLGGAPAQPELKVSNLRLTVGELGPTREGNKLLPGDILFIAFDIEGLTIDEKGVAKYTMGMEVTNPSNRVILNQAPTEREDFAPLRGNRLPGRAFVTVGLDETPGVFTCTLTVSDPSAKLKTSVSVKFEVLKKDFGIVAVLTTHDPKGELPSPNSGQVGDTLYIHFSVAAFERDAKTKHPNVLIEFQFLDDQGRALLKEPRKQIVDATAVPPVKDGDGIFTLMFPLYLNRPGKFVVEMKATDNVSKKTATYKLPVTATAAN